MPRQSVTTQKVVRAGLNPALTAPPSDGDVVDCGAVALWVENGSGSAVTVTVVATAQVEGQPVTNLSVSVPAAGRRLVGPLPRSLFGQPQSDPNADRALVNYSVVTGVTRAVVAVG